MLFENNISLTITTEENLKNDLDSIFSSNNSLGKIISATEDELLSYWKWSGYSSFISFINFKDSCKIEGATIYE